MRGSRTAPFETYCVELGQAFSFNTTYNDYRIIQGDTYSQWAGNPVTSAQMAS